MLDSIYCKGKNSYTSTILKSVWIDTEFLQKGVSRCRRFSANFLHTLNQTVLTIIGLISSNSSGLMINIKAELNHGD